MATYAPMEGHDFERCEDAIASDDSSIGIDAKKIPMMILPALERLERKPARVERRLEGLEEQR